MKNTILTTIITVSAFMVIELNSSIAESVLVPVTANVYGSGHGGAAATPQPAGGGGGTAPPSIDVLTTTQFGFLGSGSAKFSPVNPTSTTPDGPAGPPATFNGYNGLSGFSSDHGYALYGVFVGAIEPADPQPAALNFVGTTTFASLSPQLDQVFYIGDGLTGTGSGSTQVFNVPSGALKLYFGLADGINSPIDNGYYGDNSGPGYLVEISRAVPEPGDYNEDDVVDAADYVTWRANETDNLPLPNDNGTASQAARYDLWTANFGESSPGGGSQSSVPEPSALLLLCCAVIAVSLVRLTRPTTSPHVR